MHGSCEEGEDILCKCDDGHYGLNCEFQACPILEIDSQFEGFLGDRDWSSRYEVLRVLNETVQVYGRPVYINETTRDGNVDIIMFTGRRWVVTHSGLLDLASSCDTVQSIDDDDLKATLADCLTGFHGHFSNFTATFISEPMDVETSADAATPIDLQWFNRRVSPDALSIDLKRPLQALLLCAICDESNPCFYDGVCSSNGSCQCSLGSKGTLCQIPPIGNGHCDPFFNSIEFRYDGKYSVSGRSLSTLQKRDPV